MNRKGSNKTPARVQIFYFEKKKPGRLATDPSAAVTTTDLPVPDSEALTSPANEVPLADLQREAAAKRRNARSRRGAAPRDHEHHHRRTTEKIPALGDGPHAPTEREAPRLPTPAAVPGGCAREALEYHRQKLQRLAARAGGPTKEIADMALFGHTLYARGRLREAQVVFESIVSREPDEAAAYTMLGAIYLALDDDARALALFDAALGLEGGDLAALVGRGEIRLRRGQPQAAVQDLERAIGADPSGRDPFSERARALLVLAKTLSRTLR